MSFKTEGKKGKQTLCFLLEYTVYLPLNKIKWRGEAPLIVVTVTYSNSHVCPLNMQLQPGDC